MDFCGGEKSWVFYLALAFFYTLDQAFECWLGKRKGDKPYLPGSKFEYLWVFAVIIFSLVVGKIRGNRQ